MNDALSRRAALGLLAAGGAALPLARAVPAAAQIEPPFGPRAAPAGLRFGAFAVDTRRLALTGDPERAAVLAQDLQRQLRAVFADLTVPRGAGGATLSVRIASLFLPLWGGGRTGGNGGDGIDNIEGVGLVVAGGRVLSQTPVYTTLEPSYSGAWYLPDIDRRRVDSIAHQFAYWLRREMGV